MLRFPLQVALLCLVTSASLPAQLPYNENFNNPGGNAAVSLVGWNSYLGSLAEDYTNTAPGTGQNRIGLSNIPGNPAVPNGFLFAFNQQTLDLTFAATVTGLTLDNPELFTWRMGNAGAQEIRLLVQIDSNWYATDSVFTTTPGFTAATFTSSAEIKSFTFTTEASSWRDFTINPGVEMTLGSVRTIGLPSAAVTGVGFYMNHVGLPDPVTTRIDTLSIVPEPTSVALLTLGLGAMVWRIRRRITPASDSRRNASARNSN